MSRRRYISTNTSTDKAFNTLGRQHGDFAAMLYLLMIPHAEDDGTLTGEPEELLAKVVPMRRDKDVPDIVEALTGMEELGLIHWDRGADRISFPSTSFYKYQSYVPENKRAGARGQTQEEDAPQDSAKQRVTAPDAEKQRETPQNSAFPSPSLSPSVSPSEEEDANANALSAPTPPAAPRRKPSREEDENAGQEAMTFFQAGYFGVHDTRYEPADGDTLALKRLRLNLKRDRFEEVVTRFLSCRNDFVHNRRAHAIGLLCRELNAFTSDEAMARAYPDETALSRGRASPRASFQHLNETPQDIIARNAAAVRGVAR